MQDRKMLDYDECCRIVGDLIFQSHERRQEMTEKFEELLKGQQSEVDRLNNIISALRNELQEYKGDEPPEELAGN